MPIDNPYFAQILARQLMDAHHQRSFDAPIRYEIRDVQRRSNLLHRLRRAVRRSS